MTTQQRTQLVALILALVAVATVIVGVWSVAVGLDPWR